MNDYINGIAYGTGYIAKENGDAFLFVRNLDPYYAKKIEDVVPYKAYESKSKISRDGRPQWCIKARSIKSLPALSEIVNKNDFIRAYMELHSMIDLMNAKDRNGNRIKRLRLRIYGNEEILSFINESLPAKTKKIQYIKNKVDKNYIGETFCLYYQSKKEIFAILNWIDGTQKNKEVWGKWKKIVEKK